MIEFFRQILKDKDGNYALRETVTMIFVAVTLISWIAQQFFGITIPEYMFYSFVGIISAGCFGYSLERRTRPSDDWQKTKSFFNENKNQ